VKVDRAPFSAHSIFEKSPREKRKSMESGNGARADAPTSGRRGAAFVLVRITTESKRTWPVQVTTRAARGRSFGIVGKIGSGGV